MHLAPLRRPGNVEPLPARTPPSLTPAHLASGGQSAELAFRQLRLFIVDRLASILVPRGVCRDLCQDFAQEALLKVRAKLPTFRGDSTVEAWALSIAMRVAFDELRTRRFRCADVAEGEQAGACAPDVHAPPEQERLLARARVVAQLEGAVEGSLTSRQRHVLRAGLQHVPPRETASALGIKLNAVYKLEHDARRKVKRHLEAAGLSQAEALAAFD
jgi:RNA polymerase sigma-70 factor (ECF subfamily)